DVAFGIEAGRRLGALVDHPQVVVAVEADSVTVAKAVDVLADLAKELAGRIELEQLRRSVAIQRPGRRAAGMVQDGDSSLRVDRNPQHFAEVHVRRDLEEVRIRIKWNLR